MLLAKNHRSETCFLSIDQLLTYARSIELELGNKPESRVRRFIECGLLPARIAMHDRLSGRKKWLFPQYAQDILFNLKKLEHLPLQEIQQFILPILAMRKRDWELGEEEEKPGPNPPVGRLHLRSVFEPKPVAWTKIRGLAIAAGLGSSRIDNLLKMVEGNAFLNGTAITDLLLLVRITAAGVEGDPPKMRDAARALQFLEYSLSRISQNAPLGPREWSPRWKQASKPMA